MKNYSSENDYAERLVFLCFAAVAYLMGRTSGQKKTYCSFPFGRRKQTL